jgi:cytochrome c oxidase subunit III
MAIPAVPQFASRSRPTLGATFGVWIFLATEVLFFGPLFFAYLYVRIHFPDAVGAASRHTDVLLGTLNTAILLTSSLCMALAAARAQGGQRAGWLLYASALLGLVFLAIKGIEYRQEFSEHLFPGRAFAPAGAGAALAHGMQLFFILYFAMTALHALHLAAGIALCVAMALALRRGSARAEHVELAGLYWHFVDLVWIFLYPLLYLVDRSGG